MDFFNHTPVRHLICPNETSVPFIPCLVTLAGKTPISQLPNSLFSHFAGARHSDRIRCSESFRSAWDDSFDLALSWDAFF